MEGRRNWFSEEGRNPEMLHIGAVVAGILVVRSLADHTLGDPGDRLERNLVELDCTDRTC